MTVIANQVTNLLFTNIKSVDELSQAQLEAFIEQYPYFAPLHFLMAAKQDDGLATHTSVYNKALLHFPNAVTLNYLLQGGGDATIMVKETVTTEVSFESLFPHASKPQAIITETESENIEVVEEEVIPVADETVTEDVIIAQENIAVLEEEVSAVVEENIETDKTEIITPLPEAIVEENEEPLDEDDAPMENGPELVIPGLKIEAIDPKTAELTLTPVHMHTVDYFASLGIKFKEQDKPIEKFDRQLKSFTDWLKVIKKVPDTPSFKLGDMHAEKKVEEMAGLSLKNEKIITETMAEVWIKQGNKAKAIDVYEKLSLLDPTKSAYFATRIENLKKSN